VLADSTYAQLVNDLSASDYQQVSPELRKDILAFYENPNAPVATKRKKKDWQKLQDELQRLRTSTTQATAEGGLAPDRATRLDAASR
jgi:hypothetical protein